MSEVNSAPVNAPVESSAPVESNAPVESSVAEKPQSASLERQMPKKQKFKYKADGQEIEEELDETEITNRLSLAKAAHKRMQEAAKTTKQVEQFIERLKNDPISILTNDKLMGQQKFREIAEQFLIKQLELEQMSPEQKRFMENENKLKEYERKEQERVKAEEAQKMQELERHWANQYEQTIISALQSSELPKNQYTVKRMAELLQKNLAMGLDLEPQQLAQLVREDYMLEHKSLIKDATPEQLLAIFGEDVVNKIRKHDLAKLKVSNPKPRVEAQPRNEEPEKRMSPREYTEFLKQKWAHTQNK